ncbi:MAG: hypothetical protein QM755_03680 [Luteolibacter sp.]
MRSARKSPALILFILAGLGGAASAEPLPWAKQPQGSNECGPCSYINSLIAGGKSAELDQFPGTQPLEKARSFSDRYGKVDSVVYGSRRTAYSDKNGTADQDLLGMINTQRQHGSKPPLTGNYLTKKADESRELFLERTAANINRSIQSGTLPLLSVRSVKATPDAAGAFKWNAITGHWVCVLSAELLPTKDGISLRMADSNSGTVLGGMLYSGMPRTSVPMSFDVSADGKEVWKWEEGSNCLFLTAPGLPLGTDKTAWQVRTYIAARYLICEGGR